MPNENKKLIRKFVQKLNEPKEKPAQEFAAIIGKTDGTVLTGVAGIIWVTKWNGESLKVINRREANIAGTHVVVGIDPSMPGRLQVLRTRYVFGSLPGIQYSPPPAVGAHAETHRITGGDTDFIEVARFMPLLVWPKGGQIVSVYGGVVQIYDGSWVQVSNQDFDLTASQPASGAVWAVIAARNTGTLEVTVSDAVQGKGLLTVSNLPTVDGIPIVAIKLYNQTDIQRDPAGINDFLDLRHFAGRSTPSTFHNLLPDIDGGGDYLGYLEAYHLDQFEWEALVKGLSADGYHFHDAGFLAYTPDNPSDWDYYLDPGSVEDALNQLAERTEQLESTPPGTWDGDITDLDIEKVRRAEVAVPLFVLGVDAGRLDRELDAALVEVFEVGDDRAVEVSELSADL